jgi:hypothetical protein
LIPAPLSKVRSQSRKPERQSVALVQEKAAAVRGPAADRPLDNDRQRLALC